VVVENFHENIAPLLEGRARRWWWWQPPGGVPANSQSSSTSVQNYKIGTLVAFSGEVNDKESGSDPFTRTARR